MIKKLLKLLGISKKPKCKNGVCAFNVHGKCYNDTQCIKRK